MAETLHSRSRSAGSTGASEPSVFERMIQNFESNGKGRADCDLVRGQSQGREWIHSGKRDKEIQKNAEWKSFIMGVTKSVRKMFSELFLVPFLCVQTIIIIGWEEVWLCVSMLNTAVGVLCYTV